MKALIVLAGTGIATVIVAMLMVVVYVVGANDADQACTPGSHMTQELYCGNKGCRGDNAVVNGRTYQDDTGLVSQTP